MSGVVARRVASTPTRTASGTWSRIVELLAPDPTSPARIELAAAAGVACSSISSEAPKGDPFVVFGVGPRVRIYCVFGDDAITGDGVNDDALLNVPTAGDWAMSIPCLPEDLKWSQAQLAAVSSRITARALGEEVPACDAKDSAETPLTINLDEYLRS